MLLIMITKGWFTSEIIDPIFVDLIYNGKLVTGSIKRLTQLIFSRKYDAETCLLRHIFVYFVRHSSPGGLTGTTHLCIW